MSSTGRLANEFVNMVAVRLSGKTKINQISHVANPSPMSNPDSLRLSFDSDRAPSPPAINGHNDDTDDLDPLARLQRELDRTREEKESLAAQYRNLLAKLTTMRTTLGNKLKQDAVRV